MRRRAWIVAVMAAFLCLPGCDESTMMGDDAGGRSDAGPPIAEDAGFDAGPLSNDTFEGASVITLEESPWMGLIETPGDIDLYRLEGTEGQWLVIGTTANPDSDEDMLNTVVSLFDETETRIA